MIGSSLKSESGNVFFALFGAVALVGTVGAASMQVMKGPVRAMSEVTKRTVAENNMIASTKLVIISSANEGNADCDLDGFIEPIEPEDAGAGPKPVGGGYLPSTVGASLTDPWGTRFALCSWDHGGTADKCGGAKPLLRTGGPVDNQYAIAVISAGADRVFQSACNDFVDTTPADGKPDTLLITKSAGSDDIVLGYTYAEANNIGGGLWTLKDGDNNKATIAKDIEVRTADDSTVAFGLDRTSGQAEFMAIKTDNIYAKSSGGGSITMNDPVKLRIKGYEGLAAPTGGMGGGGGGGSDNLGDHTATQNLTFFGAAGGAGVSGTESDPQVGALTALKWCATNAGGTAIVCDKDPPSGGSTLPTDCPLGSSLIYGGATWTCSADMPVWQTSGGSSGSPAFAVITPNAISETVSAADDDGAVTYTKQSGDAWLSIDSSTGEITGTAPGTAGSYSIVVRASDVSGNYADRTFYVKVYAALVSYGGYQWAYGDDNVSCDALCAVYNKSCNLTGTRNYAGSSGNNTQCQNVLAALGAPGSTVTSNSMYIGDYGCAYNTFNGRMRYTQATTTCSGSASQVRRACACN